MLVGPVYEARERSASVLPGQSAAPFSVCLPFAPATFQKGGAEAVCLVLCERGFLSLRG